MQTEQTRALYNLSEFFTWRTAILRADLPAVCKYTLLVLSCHMNEVGGSCFPSIRTISEETGMSRPTVIKSVRRAIKAGWLEKSSAGLAGQKWRRNTYKATIPDVVKPVDQLQKGGKSEDEGGKANLQKVVNPVYPSTSVNSPITLQRQNPIDKAKIQEHVKNLKAKLLAEKQQKTAESS